MISVSNVTMRYGSKLLFEDVSVTFTTGRRYGLTGPNGAGKSTFMKVLTGEIDAAEGHRRPPKENRRSQVRTSTPSTPTASSTPSSWATKPSGPPSKSARSSTPSPR